MNKILMDKDEKELIIDGKYVFKENGTFSLEIEDLDKELFLVVSKGISVVLNILGKI